jgi:hypothetical protein
VCFPHFRLSKVSLIQSLDHTSFLEKTQFTKERFFVCLFSGRDNEECVALFVFLVRICSLCNERPPQCWCKGNVAEEAF